MKVRTSRLATGLVGVMIVLAVVPVGARQDSVALARDLYLAASYEEALEMLTRLDAGAGQEGAPRPASGVGEGVSIQQYRVLCLLALGRESEAERAIEVIVLADPSFSPSPSDVSPRVRDRFTGVRRRLLPRVVRRDYASAKASFDRREFAEAAEGFGRVRDLLGDPELAGAAAEPPLPDYAALSAGFYALSVASPDPLPAGSWPTRVADADPSVE